MLLRPRQTAFDSIFEEISLRKQYFCLQKRNENRQKKRINGVKREVAIETGRRKEARSFPQSKKVGWNVVIKEGYWWRKTFITFQWSRINDGLENKWMTNIKIIMPEIMEPLVGMYGWSRVYMSKQSSLYWLKFWLLVKWICQNLLK